MGCKDSRENSDPKKISKSGVTDLKRIYKINPHILGAGSFGKVFLAENLSDNTHKVAIKVLNKEKLGKNVDLIR
jgi:serine/threonine protein kinase